MQNRLPVTAILVILAILLSLLVLKVYVGDVRPAIVPASQNISKVFDQKKVTPIPKGERVGFPLTLPAGFDISLFAKDLGNPRDLTFSSGNTLLVSIPASGKILALPDSNNDGSAEAREILTGLNKPHGIAFFGDKLFVAEETSVSRYTWDEQKLAANLDKKLFDLPKGGRHFTRSIAFDKDGKMFISIGSTCDVCFEKNDWLGAVIVSDKEGNNPRLWASGLRNTVFIAIKPATQELWGADMGRDLIGDNIPPEEINIIKEGKNYGWPVCYGHKIYDTKFNSGKFRDYCDGTETPVYEFQAHSAPLGLTFINSEQFPKEWQGDLLVAYHGSWNRSTPTGYKVVRLNIEKDKIVGEEDFLTGFLEGSNALGRPVDLEFDNNGNLYISDDKAGAVYRVTYK